ncbi:MAG: helicase-related protein [Longimicrobiales bacterium]
MDPSLFICLFLLESPVIQLARPRLLGGAIEMVAAIPSPEQEAAVAALVQRAEHIRKGGVDPRKDNMLAVTNDGRKVALDMRVLSPHVGDFVESKVNLLVDRVDAIWAETTGSRLTQLIFCDLSKPVVPGRGFSVYNDVRQKLIARGVPPAEIAFIHDAGNDLKKARLFADVRAGRVRILLGSTQKMGLGTNVQDRLYAMHHLDAPWRPADIEQRDGRMMRRGNTNPFVRILRYVTQRTFDAYMWQVLEYKARMIAQVMRGDAAVRRIEDLETPVLTYAQMKALASGNPLVMEKAAVDAEVARLSRAKRAFEDRSFTVRLDLARLPERIREAEDAVARIDGDIARRLDTIGERFRIEIDERHFTRARRRRQPAAPHTHERDARKRGAPHHPDRPFRGVRSRSLRTTRFPAGAHPARAA